MHKPNCHIENIYYSKGMPLLEQTQEGAYLYCRLHIRSSLNSSLATNGVKKKKQTRKTPHYPEGKGTKGDKALAEYKRRG